MISNSKAQSPPIAHRQLVRRSSCRNPKRGSDRLGAAAVEFAVIAPIMIFMTFGLIELGRLSQLRDSAIHATREGARVAIKPTSSAIEINNRIEEELELMGIQGGTSTVEYSNDVSSGSQLVTVHVHVPITSNSWMPNFLTLGVDQLHGSTTMRMESTN